MKNNRWWELDTNKTCEAEDLTLSLVVNKHTDKNGKGILKVLFVFVDELDELELPFDLLCDISDLLHFNLTGKVYRFDNDRD